MECFVLFIHVLHGKTEKSMTYTEKKRKFYSTRKLLIVFERISSSKCKEMGREERERDENIFSNNQNIKLLNMQ